MAEALPPPPAADELPDLQADDVCVLARDVRILRISFREGRHPGAWDAFRDHGPLRTGRFDHHLTPPRRQERAILYGSTYDLAARGAAAVTCVAEVFQETRTIDPSRRAPWLVAFALVEPLTLLDVTSGWTTRVGGNQAINSGERRAARRWSRAIYERYPELDGVFYASSVYGPGRGVALYERAMRAVPERPVFHGPLNDPGLRNFLKRAALDLGYEFLG